MKSIRRLVSSKLHLGVELTLAMRQLQWRAGRATSRGAPVEREEAEHTQQEEEGGADLPAHAKGREEDGQATQAKKESNNMKTEDLPTSSWLQNKENAWMEQPAEEECCGTASAKPCIGKSSKWSLRRRLLLCRCGRCRHHTKGCLVYCWEADVSEMMAIDERAGWHGSHALRKRQAQGERR